MRPTLLLIGLVLFVNVLLSLPTSAQPANQDSADQDAAALSVMTWNLEWFYDDATGDNFGDLPREKSSPDRPSWDWRRDAVATAVADVAPTVVALQEIENQRVLYYLNRALDRNHRLKYRDAFIQGTDYFTEQDVGFIYDSSIDLLRISRHGQTSAQRASKQFYNVSKHVEAVFQIPTGDTFETVTVMNMHLRAKPEVAAIRARQARLVHAWVAQRIAAGENIIVLGDINTEFRGGPLQPGSDMAAIAGLDTPSPLDDLVNLNQYLPSDQQQTHLLPDRQFDQILVSRSLVENDPQRPDLVFSKIERRRDLAVQGDVDSETEHWDQYWKLPADQRDLSDHWPLLATFVVQ